MDQIYTRKENTLLITIFLNSTMEKVNISPMFPSLCSILCLCLGCVTIIGHPVNYDCLNKDLYEVCYD